MNGTVIKRRSPQVLSRLGKGVGRGGNRKPQTFKNCEECGVLFGPLDHLKVRFCSPACKKLSQRGVTPWNKGKIVPQTRRAETRACLTCGKTFRATKDYGRRKQRYCCHRCYLRNRRVSHFEQEVGKRLRERGIAITSTFKVGTWSFDYRLAGTRILVEADGTYWHSHPKIAARDQRKNKWCMQCDWVLIRISEAEFRRDPDAEIEKVVSRWEKLTGKKAVKWEG